RHVARQDARQPRARRRKSALGSRGQPQAILLGSLESRRQGDARRGKRRALARCPPARAILWHLPPRSGYASLFLALAHLWAFRRSPVTAKFAAQATRTTAAPARQSCFRIMAATWSSTRRPISAPKL